MARMIPSLISPEIKSSAEKKIFEWFQNDPETDGWVVLHSLGIANHRVVMYGEIDFVVIAPKLGVFALEVKGGRVRRENGLWSFTDRYNNTKTKERGPFEQANEGIFSLFDSIKRKCGANHYLNRLLFGTGVMFPDIEFEVADIDAEQWQVFDINDGSNVNGFIKRLSKNVKQKWVDKYGRLPEEKIPDVKAVKELVNLLRSDFDKAVSLSTHITYTEKKLITLTEEQLKCLDQLEDNSRCLIQGPAGTGKTLLAVEQVKKSAVNNEKVALFCFNTLLGDWLKVYFNKIDESLRPSFVGTFHSFLFQQANKNYDNAAFISEDESSVFYRHELPLLAMEALENNNQIFDRIIIDEAQDLITPEYLDVLDLILRNGLNRGKWNLFGDFEMQAIFDNGYSSAEMKGLLDQKTAYVKYKLKINCRNTKPIGDEIKYITGFDNSNYQFVTEEGLPVQYFTYKDDESQKNKIEELLDKLVSQKIDGSQITILSPLKKESSVISRIKSQISIKDFSPVLNKEISFCTIQGFKGLENSVVILVDINTFNKEKMMYVALSRARSVLYIFESEEADKERRNLLKRWI